MSISLPSNYKRIKISISGPNNEWNRIPSIIINTNRVNYMSRFLSRNRINFSQNLITHTEQSFDSSGSQFEFYAFDDSSLGDNFNLNADIFYDPIYNNSAILTGVVLTRYAADFLYFQIGDTVSRIAIWSYYDDHLSNFTMSATVYS